MFEGMNNVDFESNVVGNNNVVDNDMNVDINMMNNVDSQMISGGYQMNPISEAVQTKCVHRTIMHEVPHDCFFL